jgi:hypothetical protein
MTQKTLEQMAREYVDLFSKPANGWGQHVHPIYGQSHALYWHMVETFGDLETIAAIHQAERGEDKQHDT